MKFRACDPVACAVEQHVRSLESEGFGQLVVEEMIHGVRVTFGETKVCAENYDIALVRLAGALIDDANIGDRFLERLRSIKIEAY